MYVLGFFHEWRHAVISFPAAFLTGQSTAFVYLHRDESPAAIVAHLKVQTSGQIQINQISNNNEYLDIPRADEWVGAFEREFHGFKNQFLLGLAVGMR